MDVFSIVGSQTSVVQRVFLQDATATNGAGLTGLTAAAAGLTLSYARDGAGAVTVPLTPSGGLGQYTNVGAAGSGGGFIEVDATHLPGVYEISLPDAMIAVGAASVRLMLFGAVNLVVYEAVFQLSGSLLYSTGGSAPVGWPTLSDVVIQLARAGVTMRNTTGAQSVLDAVVSIVGNETKRQFIADTVDTTRLFSGTGTAEMDVDEMVSLTSVAVIGIQSAPGYPLANVNLVSELNKPLTRMQVAQGSVPAWLPAGVLTPYPAIFPSGRSNIQVTGRFGYGASIPDDLWQAVLDEMCSRFTREAIFTPSGRVVSRQEEDEVTRYQFAGVEATQWTPQFRQALIDYRRPAGRRLRNLRPRMI